MPENLHIFLDPLGRYAAASYQIYNRIQPGNNIIINLRPPSSHVEPGIEITESIDRIKNIVSENNIKRVYFHYFSYYVSHILVSLKKQYLEVKYIWIFWSGDFYDHVLSDKDIYIEDTLPYIPRHNAYKSKLKPFLSGIKGRLLGRPPFSKQRLFDRYKMLDYVCTTFEGDYNNILTISGARSLKRLPYSYFSIEELFGTIPDHWKDNPEEDAKDKDLLMMIGHSAAPYNNHLEILRLIKDWDNISRILLPVSYGNEVYKLKLKKYAIDTLGVDSVIFQEDFLQLKDYYQLLDRVDIVVLNNKVQKGFGNIIPLLWKGVKVFLRKESPVYLEFKKEGMIIFNIQEDLSQKNIKPLSSSDIAQNRSLLLKLFSSSKVEEEIVRALNL